MIKNQVASDRDSDRVMDQLFSMEVGVSILQAVSHDRSVKAGWYNNPETGEPLIRDVGNMLMLCVTELAEACEGDRKGLMDDHLPNRPMVEVELADAMIRIADLAGYLKLDLAGAVVDKLEYNLHRKDHQIENRALAGGKKY